MTPAHDKLHRLVLARSAALQALDALAAELSGEQRDRVLLALAVVTWEANRAVERALREASGN
jgi:hypothetical protein